MGDGTSDDTAAISAALTTAAKTGGGVYVPAGIYKVSTLSIPDGITVQGAGHAASWIKGGILFGSHDLIRGLKLGDVGKRTHNAPGATRTVFDTAASEARRRSCSATTTAAATSPSVTASSSAPSAAGRRSAGTTT